WASCVGRSYPRPANAGRVWCAPPGFRADCDRQSRGTGAGWNPDLAEPSADHQRGPARAHRISLLRARPGRDPLRGHDRRARGIGADLNEGQWREVVRVVCDRRLTPLIDIAYQGFGRGLDEDAFGVRLMLDA